MKIKTSRRYTLPFGIWACLLAYSW